MSTEYDPQTRGKTIRYYLESPSVEPPKELDPRLQGASLQTNVMRVKQVLKSAVMLPRQFEKANPAEAKVEGHRENGTNPYVDVLLRLGKSSRPEDLKPYGLHLFHQIDRIATGAVRLKDIPKLREKVDSLKAATELRLQLKYSLPASRCTAEEFQRNFPPNGLDGTGVIVGIVDRGCDFAHRNFRDDSGNTRLLYLWDQRRTAEDARHLPQGFNYGQEFDSTQIDGALLQTDPYGALHYELAAATHGTHVMDIAAGNGKGTGRPGVAPKANLIFVDLAVGDPGPGQNLSETQRTAARRFGTEEHLGNSRYLLEAVAYIFAKAERLGRPCVVNLSLGTYGGPHDGTTLVEMGFEELLKKPGRAIVISAGNAGEMDVHASGKVAKSQSKSLVWEFDDKALGEEECEVWYNSVGEGLIVALKDPDGNPVCDNSGNPVRVAPGEIYELKCEVEDKKSTKDKESNKDRDRGGIAESCGYIIHRKEDPNHANGTVNQVNLRLPSQRDGHWTIDLETTAESPIKYDAWIDDGRHSSFREFDRQCTLGAICCSENTIVVSAYDARMANAVALGEGSLGPTRDGKNKPEVSAPGAGICAACARSHGGLLELSGTSMAAPHVTGIMALLFQLTGPKMGIEEMRRELMKKDPLQSTGWNNPYGYGRVDGVAAALALAPKAKLTLKNGNGGSGDTGTKPPILQFIDPQGNRWQAELKPMP